jgi:hypothetical protein
VAIPLKLPAPDFGTDEQAGPKSIAAAAPEEDAAAAGLADEDAGFWVAAAVDDEDEPHAAVARPRLTASPDRARRRYFISVFSFTRFSRLGRQVTVTTTESQPLAPLGKG